MTQIPQYQSPTCSTYLSRIASKYRAAWLFFATLIPFTFPAWPQTCAGLSSTIATAVKQHQNYIKFSFDTPCLATSLDIDGASNLIIDGQGSSLIFQPTVDFAIRITRSKNVTLRNFSVDYSPLPYTQGRVTEIRNNTVFFETDTGYPLLSSLSKMDRAYLFDSKTRLWKRGVSTLYPASITPSEGKNGRMELKPRDIQSVEKNDLIVFNQRKGSTIVINGMSQNINLENIKILSSPGIAVLARYVSGQNNFAITVDRGPMPAGADSPRLLSSNADAFNYAYARTGPILKNSSFAFQGDDGVNLHGMVMPIVGVDGMTFTAFRPYANDGWAARIMEEGDPVRILSPNTFEIIATGHLSKIERIDGDPQNLPYKGKHTLFSLERATRSKIWTFYRIELKDKIKIPEGAFADFPALATPNFAIERNQFKDSRGHAIVLGASNGTIKNNAIERMTQNAIFIGPQYSPWLEGSWVNNVSIMENTIKDVCLDPSSITVKPRNEGAISVSAQLGQRQTNYPTNNENVSILRNSISQCSGPGIYLNATARAKVHGNILRDVGFGPATKGMNYSFSDRSVGTGSTKELELSRK